MTFWKLVQLGWAGTWSCVGAPWQVPSSWGRGHRDRERESEHLAGETAAGGLSWALAGWGGITEFSERDCDGLELQAKAGLKVY